ncbi:hypothetical protein DOFOFD_07440 [Acetobacteraceae bacterium EV16P]|uniref:Uncharacterized protein n=1 Tax=Sorlinia euscelidii TaxID=3081148 RepID=A0ABU7U4M1_9PROT
MSDDESFDRRALRCQTAGIVPARGIGSASLQRFLVINDGGGGGMTRLIRHRGSVIRELMAAALPQNHIFENACL